MRRGLRQILSETPDIMVAGEAGTAAEVMALVREQRWTVVVLDISLPGATGLTLLADVKREKPETPVLVLTAHPEDQYAVRAIRAGAAGFLNKESAPDKLIEAVRKVAGGGRYVSAELAETLASRSPARARASPTSGCRTASSRSSRCSPRARPCPRWPTSCRSASRR